MKKHKLNNTYTEKELVKIVKEKKVENINIVAPY